MKNNYRKIAQSVISLEIDGLKKLHRSIGSSFNKAVELILKAKNAKVIFCGVGKSGQIAQKASSTFSSISVPSYFIVG